MANEYFNHVVNVIAGGVRALSAQVNNIAFEISAGLDKLPTEIEFKEGRIRYAVDTGVADAYIVTLPYTPTLTDGLNFIWKATNANTGPATINLNGLGAKSIILASGGALISGDILNNQQLWCAYESNGDNFRLLSQSSSAGGGGGNAATVALNDESVDTTNFIVFANDATGNQALFSNTGLTFDAATGSITNFKSTGIDDNAPGERLQLADTIAQFGVAGAAYTLSHVVNDQELRISGGNVAGQGAEILLFGETEASNAQDMFFRASDNTWLAWDESAGSLRIDTGVGVKTQALFISATQLATFAGAVTVQGAFTSPGIDDNASAERMQISDTVLRLGAAGVDYNILHAANDQQVLYSGGMSTTLGGASILMSGGDHANIGDMDFRNDSNTWMLWDETVGDLEILTGVGAKTSALTIDAAQLATFAGPVFLSRADLGNALRAEANHTQAVAGSFYSNTASRSSAVLAVHNDNPTGTGVALNVTQDQGGLALGVTAVNAAAIAGYFTTNAASRTNPVVEIVNDNPTGSGVGLLIQQDQGGAAIELTSQGTIKFPATATPSSDVNTLDDYQEGTWTPYIADNTLSDSEGQTYTYQTGWYTKIGRQVHFGGQLSISSLGSLTAVHGLKIGGIPFIPNSTYNSPGFVSILQGSSLNKVSAADRLVGTLSGNPGWIYISKWSATTGDAVFAISELSADGVINFAGSYII